MYKTDFSIGNDFYRKGEFEQAIESYKKSLSKFEFNHCYENLSLALYKKQDYKTAREMLFKAYSLSNDTGKERIKKTNRNFEYLHADIIPEKSDINRTLPVSDLKTKLWGGFSQQALHDLDNCLSDSNYQNKDKALAAFILGRWYALSEDWESAINYIKQIRKFDIKLYRGKKVKLLLIECLMNANDLEQAQELIDFVLEKRIEGDFLCARNNLLKHKNTKESSIQRLASLNMMYENAGLSPIKLKSEKKGLVFGNIRYDQPKKTIENGPKISILVPVYNAEEFIDVAIHSLLSQSWKNIEIIAVEDCSPDNSWAKLQELAQKDTRLKIFKNEKNLGAYPTRNKALSLATGDFITVHDSDDWSHPQMLEVQMQAMLENPDIKISCSAMTRVYPDIQFILRPQRENLEYIHRSYPSVLIRREDLNLLGEWDGISANADDEFVQRARLLWGAESVVDILPDVPLSFFLVHENSLTQQKGTSLNTLTFGIRKEYSRQAAYWRRKNNMSSSLSLSRTSLKSPFPIPQGLAPKNWDKKNNYDIVLVSDLSLLGGTRRCNEGYIEAASELGLKIGIFHWPRYDLKFTEIADEYMELSYRENIDILVPEDEIIASTVIIHHPPILNYEIDAVPKIKCKNVAILVNQSPMQLWSQEPFYYDSLKASKLCERLFGHRPTWIPISPRAIQTLRLAGGFDNMYEEIWYPPFNGKLSENEPLLPIDLGSDRAIKLGRHARDHWTKWPSDKKDLLDAYCANVDKIKVELLGGLQTPEKILNEKPNNWNVLEFDSISVPEFIKGLDFFLHFTHSDYIEEFGRNIMEAMALGRVVILPTEYKDIFGSAAIYSSPENVKDIILTMWNDPDAYKKQTKIAFNFVREHCSIDIVKEKISRLISYSTEG